MNQRLNWQFYRIEKSRTLNMREKEQSGKNLLGNGLYKSKSSSPGLPKGETKATLKDQTHPIQSIENAEIHGKPCIL